jgi:hypothetical protein
MLYDLADVGLTLFICAYKEKNWFVLTKRKTGLFCFVKFTSFLTRASHG